MAFKITKYYDDIFKAQENSVNKRYDAQIDKQEVSTDKTIIASENSYDSAYADNAVQKAINERNIKESLSSVGLADSGLNRTQQTAVNLQKANSDNLVTMQKQNFINKAKSALEDFKFNAELQRETEIDAIETEKAKAKADKTEEIINTIINMTDPTQAAAYIKTVSGQYGINPNKLVSYSSVVNKKGYAEYLKNKNYFVNRDSYRELHTTLAGFDTTSAAGQTAAAKSIKAWANTHKNSATISKIKKLCASAGISYSEYQAFLKNGQYFANKEKAASSSRSGSGGGGGGGTTDFEKQWYADIDDATQSILNAYERNADIWPSDQRHIRLAPLVKTLMSKYEQSQVESAIANAGFDVDACMSAAGYTPLKD